MKKFQFIRPLLYAVIVAAISLLVIACEKEDDVNENGQSYTLSGNASGNQEVPPVSTSASAILTGTYNRETNALTYSINWTGLSGTATAIHFHGPAPLGMSAADIHGLTIITNGVSGSAAGSLVIADSTESHLLDGKIYYNIHTVLNPAGEIRGQVTVAAD